MCRNLVIKEIKENRWKIIIGLVILIITGASLPLTHDLLFEIMDSLEDIPGFLGANLTQQLDIYMADYDMYIWSQWNGKNLTQIVLVISLLLGASSIASETNKGTMDFLLSKPISKVKVFISKATVGISFILILVVIPTLTTLLVSILTGNGGFGSLVFLGLIPVFFGMVSIYFLGVLLSIYCDDSIKAFVFSAGILLLNFILGFTKATQKLSMSYHYKGIDYIANGSFPYQSVIILVIVSFVLGLLSYRAFKKREY